MRLLDFNTFLNVGQFLTERDVLNAPEIKQWAMKSSSRVNDPLGRTWMQSQLYDFLINRTNDPMMVKQIQGLPPGAPEWLIAKVETGSPVFNVKPSPDLDEQIQSVTDWINNWMDENQGSRIPYTWEQAVQASVEWHKDLAKGKSHGDEQPDDDGLSLLMEFPDGFRWVMVRSAVCLKREGGRMGHCVGGYHKEVEAGSTVILSLRSPRNTPHCTIEVNEPDQVWWNRMIAFTQTASVDRRRAAENPNQMAMNFGSSQPPTTTHAGKINQIKGKQNRPPVPKYIPYVKALLEKYPFTVTSYGSGDLEAIGYYFRDGTLKNLKQIAKVFRKYPTGNAWVYVPPAEKTEYGSTSLMLVDKAWTITNTATMYEHEGQNTLSSISSPASKSSSQYRDEVMDLVKTWKGDYGSYLPGSLIGYGIYTSYPTGGKLDVPASSDKFRFGTPDEVSDVKVVLQGIEPTITVYQLVLEGTLSKTALVMMDDHSNVIGTIPYSGSGSDIYVGIPELKSPIYSSMTDLLLSISKSIGLKIRDPELLGIQPDGSTKPKETYGELVIESNDRRYEFYEPDVASKLLWVFDTQENGDIPIARITLNDRYTKVESAVYTQQNWSDAGLIGYLLLTLIEEGRGNYDLGLRDYDWHDYGWMEDAGSYYYVGGAGNIMVSETITRTSADGEETFDGPNEVAMDQIDEMAVGSEFSSYAYYFASILSHRHYRHSDTEYNGDDEEEHVEYYWELIDGQDERYLEYYYYDIDMVRKIMSGK